MDCAGGGGITGATRSVLDQGAGRAMTGYNLCSIGDKHPRIGLQGVGRQRASHDASTNGPTLRHAAACFKP